MLENPGGALCSEAAVRNTVCRKNSLEAAPRSLLEPEGSCTGEDEGYRLKPEKCCSVAMTLVSCAPPSLSCESTC